MKYYNNVSFADKRAFIDVAVGCGNSCIYCYCENSNKTQKVITLEELNDSIDFVIGSNEFIAGEAGTLISLCPHTEPFKNDASTDAILLVIDKILPFGNRIQISTKEVIPEKFMNCIFKRNVKWGQIIIFVSISSISNYKYYEPLAADIFKRLHNISRLKSANIANCLYVKPFLITDTNEVNNLLKVIEKNLPDAVCIGIEYKYSNEGRFKHPTDHNISSVGVSETMREFASKYNLDIPLFYTSSCVVSYINKLYNTVIIPRELCVNCCLMCGENGKWLR